MPRRKKLGAWEFFNVCHSVGPEKDHPMCVIVLGFCKRGKEWQIRRTILNTRHKRQPPSSYFRFILSILFPIWQLGRAFWSSFTPAAVTLVPSRPRNVSCESPFSSFSPVSVTPVLAKQRYERLLSSFSSFSPESVTRGLLSHSFLSCLICFNSFTPASVI